MSILINGDNNNSNLLLNSENSSVFNNNSENSSIFNNNNNDNNNDININFKKISLDLSINSQNFYFKDEEKINNILNSDFFKTISKNLKKSENMELTNKFNNSIVTFIPESNTAEPIYYLTNNKEYIYEISIAANNSSDETYINNGLLVRPRIIYEKYSSNIFEMMNYNVRYLIGSNEKKNHYYFIDIRQDGIMLFKEEWYENYIQQIYNKFFLYKNTNAVITNNLINEKKAYKINSRKTINNEWIVNNINLNNNIENFYKNTNINLNEFIISKNIKIPNKYVNQEAEYTIVNNAFSYTSSIYLKEDILELIAFDNNNDISIKDSLYIIGYKEINNNIQVLVNSSSIQPSYLGGLVTSPVNFRTFIFDFNKKEHYFVYCGFFITNQNNLEEFINLNYASLLTYFKSNDYVIYSSNKTFFNTKWD